MSATLKKKRKKKKPITTKILTNYSASSMLMHTDVCVRSWFLVLFALLLVLIQFYRLAPHGLGSVSCWCCTGSRALSKYLLVPCHRGQA